MRNKNLERMRYELLTVMKLRARGVATTTSAQAQQMAYEAELQKQLDWREHALATVQSNYAIASSVDALVKAIKEAKAP